VAPPKSGTNHRTDAYGGPVAQRARLLVDVMAAVAGEVGAGPWRGAGEGSPPPNNKAVLEDSRGEGGTAAAKNAA